MCIRDRKVGIPFGGKRGKPLLRGLDVVNVQSPPSFAHLSPDCKPIVTKFSRLSGENEHFIRSEIQRLLKHVSPYSLIPLGE